AAEVVHDAEVGVLDERALEDRTHAAQREGLLRRLVAAVREEAAVGLHVAAQAQPVALAVARADLEAGAVRRDQRAALLVARGLLAAHLELPPEQPQLVLDGAQPVAELGLLGVVLGAGGRGPRGTQQQQEGQDRQQPAHRECSSVVGPALAARRMPPAETAGGARSELIPSKITVIFESHQKCWIIRRQICWVGSTRREEPRCASSCRCCSRSGARAPAISRSRSRWHGSRRSWPSTCRSTRSCCAGSTPPAPASTPWRPRPAGRASACRPRRAASSRPPSSRRWWAGGRRGAPSTSPRAPSRA